MELMIDTSESSHRLTPNRVGENTRRNHRGTEERNQELKEEPQNKTKTKPGEQEKSKQRTEMDSRNQI